jgi:hypothetical protein
VIEPLSGGGDLQGSNDLVAAVQTSHALNMTPPTVSMSCRMKPLPQSADASSIALRPAAVIMTLPTSIGGSPALITLRPTVASPARTRPAGIRRVRIARDGR